MIPLNIKVDSSKGITILSNVFIDQYMHGANDAQIKVYLYLLRMVSANLPTDISEIADKFNHTEKDIIRSLKYWDELNLISITYDNAGNITGITFRDLVNDVPKANIVKKIPADSNSEKDIPMISMDYLKEKESYSIDDINKFTKNNEFKLLLNATAMYFGRLLNPNEIKTLIFIYDRLAFSLELTDYLIEYCANQGKKDMHFVESVAINWYEQGIDNVKKAKQTSKKADKTAYTIMKYLGKTGDPNAKELEYIKKWTYTYGFSLAIIEDACTRTTLATDKNRFQYADSILKSWSEKKVTSKKDIARLDEEYADSKSANKENIKTFSNEKSKFLKMQSQDYDIAAIEKALTK